MAMDDRKYSPFDKGDPVTYNNLTGVVNFICDRYITITTRNGKHKSQDTNLVVFNDNWDEVQPVCK